MNFLQGSHCITNRLLDVDTTATQVFCVIFSSLAMLFYPNVSIAMYILWKFIEVCIFTLFIACFAVFLFIGRAAPFAESSLAVISLRHYYSFSVTLLYVCLPSILPRDIYRIFAVRFPSLRYVWKQLVFTLVVTLRLEIWLIIIPKEIWAVCSHALSKFCVQ